MITVSLAPWTFQKPRHKAGLLSVKIHFNSNALLTSTVLFGVRFCRFVVMLFCVFGMCMRDGCMMCGLFMVAMFVILGRFPMMLGGFFVMVGGGGVMLSNFLGVRH